MSIYRIPGYEKTVTEYFDMSDRETFSHLSTIEEADQNKVLVALTSKLYQHVIEKVDDIDFGDIPKSRGDITKLPNYEKILDCVKIIRGILESSNQDLEPIITIEDTIKYLVQYKDIFVRAYQLKIEIPVVIYNVTVLSIYSSISVLISSCIEFVKSPDGTGFDIALDKVELKKTKESLLFRNLKDQNKTFADGSLPKGLNEFIKQSSQGNLSESVAAAAGVIGLGKVALSAGTIGFIYILLNIVPICRSLAYFYYNMKAKVSDYFDTQSALLQMNAYNLAAKSANSDKDVKEIQAKQLKIAEKFKKIANALSVKKNKAEVATEKEEKEYDKKLKVSDVHSNSLW